MLIANGNYILSLFYSPKKRYEFWLCETLRCITHKNIDHQTFGVDLSSLLGKNVITIIGTYIMTTVETSKKKYVFYSGVASTDI